MHRLRMSIRARIMLLSMGFFGADCAGGLPGKPFFGAAQRDARHRPER